MNRPGRSFTIIFVVAIGLFVNAGAQENGIGDPIKVTSSIAQRVKELLSRMTVKEKVAQLRSLYLAYPKIDAAVFNNPVKMDSLFGDATGKPMIVFLAHGRPLSINYAVEHANAILDGWFTGEEAGDAVAGILFGDVNPSGKLAISIPRSVGQIPIYYNHKPSAQFLPYLAEANTPLFPFGYGLSYTHFAYSAPRLSASGMPMNGFIKLSVDITNDENSLVRYRPVETFLLDKG